jgi:hypothetical protein
MLLRELLGESLSRLTGHVSCIDVMSDFVHQHIAEVKSPKGIKIGPSKRVSVKENARLPIAAVKRGRVSPTFQLPRSARQNENGTQTF